MVVALANHHVLVIEDSSGRRSHLVYAPNEYVHALPYAFSYIRLVLYFVLTIMSGGLLLFVSVWFPQVFTMVARLRLPLSCIGEAEYMLIMVHDDGVRSLWQEVKVHRPLMEKKKQEVVKDDFRNPSYQFPWSRKKASIPTQSLEELTEEGDENDAETNSGCISKIYSWFCCKKKHDIQDGDNIAKVQDSKAEKLKKTTFGAKPAKPFIWFEFKKHRYVFNNEKGEFERYLATIRDNLANIRDHIATGLSAQQVTAQLECFGKNHIDIDRPSVLLLLLTKVAHPYYLFQVFSAIVWFVEDYIVYAIVILSLSAISMAWEIFSEIFNNIKLRQLMHIDSKLRVLRLDDAQGTDKDNENAQDKYLHVTELVPGDIVLLSEGPVGADILLLSGSCVTDESSLTGEARPVSKEAAAQLNTGPIALAPNRSMQTVITEAEARKQYPHCFLHAGSTITKASSQARGVVLTTGFSTGKGELFRSILFPKPITFEFEIDSYRYLAILATIAIAAFIKRIVDGAKTGTNFGDIVVNSLDLITIAVPPALPLVLSSGVGFALKRLLQRGIFCIDAQRINSCGQLSCFCFDKTGTLTKDDLELVNMLKVNNETNKLDVTDLDIPAHLKVGMASCHGVTEHEDGKLEGYSLDLAMLRASGYEFHHEKIPEQNSKSRNNSQVATTVASEDVKIDQLKQLSDGAEIVKSDQIQQDESVTYRIQNDSDAYVIVKRFPFDANLQRTCVVLKKCSNTTGADEGNGDFYIWVKGSPETIGSLSVHPPLGLDNIMKAYSAEGHYCIGFAMKTVKQNDQTFDLNDRTTIECSLSFQGIALFKNELKPESKGTLQELYDADIDVRVITGDNALTAVYVCRELNMKLRADIAIVDVNTVTGDMIYHSADDIHQANLGMQKIDHHQFNGFVSSRVLSKYDVAITGAALDKMQTECSVETVQEVLKRTLIFARIRPQQKAWIVEQLMELGHVVGMCGDGTNDCGALKAAHVGLALSSAEASIVAPFTSKAKAITDVVVLIREGRCALTTSFLGFKFMVLYPIIQLAMASTLAHFDLMLTNNQYLWDDMAIVLGMAILMLYTGASTKLTKEKPPTTLFSPIIVASLVGQVVLFIAYFAGEFALLTGNGADTWFCSIKDAMAYLDGDNSNATNCEIYLEYNTPDNSYSYEDTVVWLFGHMHYISVAAAFNIKDPFRLPVYTNWMFSLLFLAVLGVNLWFLLDTSGVINDTFQVMPIPFDFRAKMLLMFIGHILTAIIWEFIATRVFPKCWRQSTNLKVT